MQCLASGQMSLAELTVIARCDEGRSGNTPVRCRAGKPLLVFYPGEIQNQIDRSQDESRQVRHRKGKPKPSKKRTRSESNTLRSLSLTPNQFMSYAEARAKGWSGGASGKSPAAAPSGPRKADGTPDMRYAANRASSAAPSGPRKADGTPDMRYAANRASSAAPSGPRKADGTPDMRYAANRASAVDTSFFGGGSSSYGYGGSSSYGGGASSSYYGGGGGGGGGYSGSACYSVSSNPTGPMKADGTPDMRYAANRR